MKKFMVVSLILSMLIGTTAQAFYYEAKCIVPEGKFKKCYLDFSKQESLQIRYKDLQYQGLNREILGKSIRHIAMGEKAQRRWVTSGIGVVALGPVGAFLLLWKKKSAMFSIEYKNGKETGSTLFAVNKKLGFPVSSQLENMSGQKIDYEMGSGSMQKK